MCVLKGVGSRCGWVAERLKALVLKTSRRRCVSWVRIPPHPPLFLPIPSQGTYQYLDKQEHIFTSRCLKFRSIPVYSRESCWYQCGARKGRSDSRQCEGQGARQGRDARSRDARRRARALSPGSGDRHQELDTARDRGRSVKRHWLRRLPGRIPGRARKAAENCRATIAAGRNPLTDRERICRPAIGVHISGNPPERRLAERQARSAPLAQTSATG